MSDSLTFQEAIMRLERYWADHGCLIWQPYSEKLGAGTGNPASLLRVLGPEPWSVAYVEPSYRPDDGRYAENPNRMQMHTQYQVILKPAPEDSQDLYLGSLEAIGIDFKKHDIRFVEDNWESPALGAWGLGWEVWLDGLEITQFTYFQQAGGIPLDPISLELTYGLERIIMFLQGVRQVWDIRWDEKHTYGDVLRLQEIEHCRYNFEIADVDRVRQMFALYEAEAQTALEHDLVIPAYDYILKCSHAFNILDTRGSVGVTERAAFFARMRDLTHQVAAAYVAQREREEYPFLAEETQASSTSNSEIQAMPAVSAQDGEKAPFLLEIGTEELPHGDLQEALEQLNGLVAQGLTKELSLDDGSHIEAATGTPRRLAVYASEIRTRQPGKIVSVKGPPVRAAFDADGKPTKAAEGFARSQDVAVDNLVRQEDEKGGEYVYANKAEGGRPAIEVLAEAIPEWIASLQFDRTMRWNDSDVSFSRPIRWIVALLGDQVISFEYAGVQSGRTTRGLRSEGSPPIEITSAADYEGLMAEHGVAYRRAERRATIVGQLGNEASKIAGTIPDDPALFDEVTDLVEQPTAFLGNFEREYLDLPEEVLTTVMKKHQRYFPVVGKDGKMLPTFIGVRNGGEEHLDIVRAGNEAVLRARYADAAYFYQRDTRQKLEDYLPQLATLTFQKRLGSMLDKTERIEKLVPWLADRLRLSPEEQATARRAAHLCKADLVTQMVVELTLLQGVMGQKYAEKSGEPLEVTQAIFEHYLPRYEGDALPESKAGLAVSLADRFDSLAGLFATGLAPSGSSDPYGLRRAALGVVRLLIEREHSLSLCEAIKRAAVSLPVEAPEERLRDAQSFVSERLKGVFQQTGVRYDVSQSVLAELADDPFAAHQVAMEINKWVTQDGWSDLLTAYARCKRIVRPLKEEHPLTPEHLSEPATLALLNTYQRVAPAVREGDMAEKLSGLATALKELHDPINTFFTDIMVMDEDLDIRAARLGLVQAIAQLPNGIADLSNLQGF